MIFYLLQTAFIPTVRYQIKIQKPLQIKAKIAILLETLKLFLPMIKNATIKILFSIFLIFSSSGVIASSNSHFSWAQFPMKWKNPFTDHWTLNKRVKFILKASVFGIFSFATVGGLAIIGYVTFKNKIRNNIDSMLDAFDKIPRTNTDQELSNYAKILNKLPRSFFTFHQIKHLKRIQNENLNFFVSIFNH